MPQILSHICPLVAFQSKQLLSFYFFEGWTEKRFFFLEKDKNFSHAEITFRVDHFVNPFMAINLITRNVFCLSKCEKAVIWVSREKSCKNPLEIFVLLKEPLLISFLFEALEIFTIDTVHYENTLHHYEIRFCQNNLLFSYNLRKVLQCSPRLSLVCEIK